MAISEDQLDIWAKQGSVTQSQATYATIRNCLENLTPTLMLAGRTGYSFKVPMVTTPTFMPTATLTWVYQLVQIYYYDDSQLSEADRSLFHSNISSGSGYSYDQFRGEVYAQLTNLCGETGRKRYSFPLAVLSGTQMSYLQSSIDDIPATKASTTIALMKAYAFGQQMASKL